MQLLNHLKQGANWDDAKAVKGLTVALPNVVHIVPHQVLDFFYIFLFLSFYFIMNPGLLVSVIITPDSCRLCS